MTKMFDLVLKVAIITGGANGIGEATVKQFLEEGALFVAFLDIDKCAGTRLEHELSDKYGRDKIKFFNGDVTSDKDLFNVFDYTIEKYGCIVIVVNNAGIADERIYKRLIDIDYKAVVTGSLKALEVMRKDRGGKGGTIINISSLTALTLPDTPSLYVYSGTKSAVLLFSSTLGTDAYYSYTGVRVITVAFGATLTNISNNTRGIDDISTNGTIEYFSKLPIQLPKAAALGIAEAYKKGETGSTWLVQDSKIKDITERVKKAYKVLSEEL